MSQVKMFIISLMLLCTIVQASNYCKLCENGTHTMCMYKDGPAKKCTGYVKQPLTIFDKKYIVDIHNDIRNHVASGHESKGTLGGQPSAADMYLLEWDEQLADIAQRWADQCIKLDAAQHHDICRRTEHFEVGQNILTAITGEPDRPDFSVLILNWYKQVINVIPSDIDAFVGIRRGKYLIGQYTQIVWAKTKYVGCGMSTFKDTQENDEYHHRLVCNYGPTGNVIGESVYERGLPCSKCRFRLCDGFRTNLCKSFEKRLLNLTITTEKNWTVTKKTNPRLNMSIFNKNINLKLKNKNDTTICINPDEVSNNLTKLKDIKCIIGIDSNKLNKNTTTYTDQKYLEKGENINPSKYLNVSQTIPPNYENKTSSTLITTPYSTQETPVSKRDLQESQFSSSLDSLSTSTTKKGKHNSEDRYVINEDNINLKNVSQNSRRRYQKHRHSTFRPIFMKEDEIVLPNKQRFKKAKGIWQNGHCRCNMIYRSNSKKPQLTFQIVFQWIFSSLILIF